MPPICAPCVMKDTELEAIEFLSRCRLDGDTSRLFPPTCAPPSSHLLLLLMSSAPAHICVHFCASACMGAQVSLLRASGIGPLRLLPACPLPALDALAQLRGQSSTTTQKHLRVLNRALQQPKARQKHLRVLNRALQQLSSFHGPAQLRGQSSTATQGSPKALASAK